MTPERLAEIKRSMRYSNDGFAGISEQEAEELIAAVESAVLQIQSKDAALEECIAVLRLSPDHGAQHAEKVARAALSGCTEKQVKEPPNQYRHGDDVSDDAMRG